ncbi:MAG: deoxyribodipyrimidine photo-lyase, partial [Cyclobacteriaceae bacterium]
MQEINIVWFKRDLRLTDHLPLKWASEEHLPVLAVVFMEPSLDSMPQYTPRHWNFISQSVAEINQTLPKGAELYMHH